MIVMEDKSWVLFIPNLKVIVTEDENWVLFIPKLKLAAL